MKLNNKKINYKILWQKCANASLKKSFKTKRNRIELENICKKKVKPFELCWEH